MMRAIVAGGGIALIGVLVGALYFLSAGGPSSSGQMSGNQALTVGIVALVGGIGSLFYARRLPPASNWIITDHRMDRGLPPVSTGADRSGGDARFDVEVSASGERRMG